MNKILGDETEDHSRASQRSSSHPRGLHHSAQRVVMALPAVYTNIGDVVVPTGVPPGGSFEVLMWQTRKGTRVAAKRKLWRASGMAPMLHPRQAHAADGPRAQQRPSALARAAAGHIGARSVDNVVTYPVNIASWHTSAELPVEAHPDDVGWLPGPVGGSAGRPMPAFTGRPLGVRDPTLTSRSSARRIMQSVQFSRKFLTQAVKLAQRHALAWRATHSTMDGIERAFHAADLLPQHVELWFAANTRAAAINMAIPVSSLWDSEHHLYDHELDAALPFGCYLWLNRHLAFGEYGLNLQPQRGGKRAADDAGDVPSAGERYDRYRKCRELSNIAVAQAPKAIYPSQHCGFDDLIRLTRHMDGFRQRHKAAVHTGRPVDGLNDAATNYFLWWEERGWLVEPTPEDGGDGSVDATARGESLDASACGGREAGGGGRGEGHHAEHTRLCSAATSADERARGRGGARGGGSRCGAAASSHKSAATSPSVAPDGDDNNPQAGSDGSDAEPGEESVSGVNSVASRLTRACSVLRRDVGHCIWVDQGVTNMSALKACRANGFHITGVTQANRIGLPRQFIASIKKKMVCQRGCNHGPDAPGCKRWSWTVLHKGEWELHIWNDGKATVLAVSSCASATRYVLQSRTCGSHCMLARCPEAIGLYNLFGRGPTDGGDQHRKRLSLAVRRRTRQGPKHALFDAELGFVDGSIVCRLLRPDPVSIWSFAEEFCADVLAAVSMRRATPAALAAAAERTRLHVRDHEPIDFCEERRKAARRSASTHAAKRGHACTRDDCDAGEPKRPRLYCPGCVRAGGHGWYHWACYWRSHRACLCG